MRYFLAVAVAVTVARAGAAQAATDTVRLTLAGAVQRALAQGEEMRSARADVREARGAVREATADALPEVRGSLIYTRQFASIFQDVQADSTFGPIFANSPFGAPNQWNLELRASQTLWSGGKVGAGLRAARALRHAADARAEATAAEVAFQVKRAYLNAQYAGRLVAIAEAGLSQARAHLGEVTRFRQAGTRAEYDELRARVEAANQEPVVVEARNGLDLAVLELKRLVNVPPEAPLVLETPLDGDGDGTLPVPVLAADTMTPVSERPELRAAAAAVTMQEQAVAVARADRWPTLSVATTLSHQAFPREVSPFDQQFRRSWTAEARLSVPLFLGFRTVGAVERAQAALDRARADRDRTQESVRLDVAGAEAEVRRTMTLLAAQRATVAQAERTHHLANVRYANGMATQIEVSDARLLLQQSEVNEAKAVRDYLLGLAELERALGRPVPVERRPVEQVLGTASAKGLEP